MVKILWSSYPTWLTFKFATVTNACVNELRDVALNILNNFSTSLILCCTKYYNVIQCNEKYENSVRFAGCFSAFISLSVL